MTVTGIVGEAVPDPTCDSLETLTLHSAGTALEDAGPTRADWTASSSRGMRLLRELERAPARGARVLCGGGLEGAVFAPTLVAAASADMAVLRQELFNAVIAVGPVDTLDEAVRENGVASSGVGREGVRYMVEESTDRKVVVLRHRRAR